MGLGRLHYEWDELAEAGRLLREAVAVAERRRFDRVLLHGAMALARLHQAEGRSEEAERLLTEGVAPMLARYHHPMMPMLIAAQRARLALMRGAVTPARQWAEGMDFHLDGPLTEFWLPFWLTLVRLWLATGRLDEADALLARMSEQAERLDQPGRLAELRMLAALALAPRDPRAARLALAEALALAAPGDFRRLFLDEGPPLAALLRAVVAAGGAAPYATHLLATFPDAPAPASHAPTLIEPLSEREREVLALIAEGLTNQAIAERLIIAPSTVKVHTRNLYGKLGVSNRTGAVARARALGLL